MESLKNNYVVIMAGGIGSRFWPFSRSNYPKQFHDVMDTGSSLLQLTIDRFEGICPKENIYIVTNQIYKEIVEEQLPFLNADQILLEPSGKNTAPCVAYAAYKIGQQNKDANIVVSPADHIILRESLFKAKVWTALSFAAEKDALVTLGITPSRPDTGYGYIQFDKSGDTDVKKVIQFTEKPDLETAEKLVKSGDYFWNAGIFVWSAKSVISAFEKHLPEMHKQFSSEEKKYYTELEQEMIERIYNTCESISIDYAIMEKAENVFMVPSDIGWSDLGTWKSLYEVKSKDSDDNVIDGNVVTYDVKDCMIKTPKDRLVVVQGLQGYIVAEYDNVLMICNKQEEQKVKKFVEDIKKQGKTEFY